MNQFSTRVRRIEKHVCETAMATEPFPGESRESLLDRLLFLWGNLYRKEYITLLDNIHSKEDLSWIFRQLEALEKKGQFSEDRPGDREFFAYLDQLEAEGKTDEWLQSTGVSPA